MAMSSLEWIQAVGTIATALGLATAGVWAYVKFRSRGENRPRVTFDSDIKFVGSVGDDLFLMLVIRVTNTGLVQWMTDDFNFQLRCALPDDRIEEHARFGVTLPRVVSEGSWFGDFEGFIINPSESYDFKYFARVPRNASLLQLLTKGQSQGLQLEDAVMVVPPSP